MKLTKPQRATLFAMFGGHCAYCGEVLPDKGWHADHVEPVYRHWWKADLPKTTAAWDEEKQRLVQVATDRTVSMEFPEKDVIGNHFPACRACNIDKGPYMLETWRKVLEGKPEVLRKNYSAWRHAERFGLVARTKVTKVVFYFEKCAAESEPK